VAPPLSDAVYPLSPSALYWFGMALDRFVKRMHEVAGRMPDDGLKSAADALAADFADLATRLSAAANDRDELAKVVADAQGIATEGRFATLCDN